jgi:hypothetical protein
MTEKKLGHAPRFTARVTPEILERSVQRNSNHCMLAEAIKEAHPDLTHISVDIQTIRASNPKKRERYIWLTPRVCQVGIIDFDRGQKLTPFPFNLRAGQTISMGTSSAQRLSSQAKAKAKAKRKKAAAETDGALRRPRDANAQSVMVKVGGKAPPRSVGRRRSFGLRSLEY